MKIRSLCAAIIACTLPSTAMSDDWKPLQGQYAITAQNLEPAEDELLDTHFRIQLTGVTAKELYDSMKVPETKDECTGAARRVVGKMRCLRFEDSKWYECDFSVNVMKQKIEYGVSC
jgi:hypothetical protein